ncbi:MAG: HAMP domain-containing sensor histidine kinase [Flammeovirgaceae bacterium]
MINLYNNRNAIKRIIVVVSFLIGIFSLIYTNSLVSQLAASEQKQIDFFAKAQKLIVSPDTNMTVSPDLNFLLMEIVNANQTIPVILTDQDKNPIDYRNLEVPSGLNAEEEKSYLMNWLKDMSKDYPPILVDYGENWIQYIYYTNSPLVKRLKYYPYIQVITLAVLAGLAYLTFDASRRAEENRVWVGLAKETAHQLGTPISSLMAWVEFFRSDTEKYDENITKEIEKDIKRLETITARFSSIGSVPTMQKVDLKLLINNIIEYLSSRISQKVKIKIESNPEKNYEVELNIPLFEWVIENLCKNAVDAMSGSGKIDIFLDESPDKQKVWIDVRDTGKGIEKHNYKNIFQAGYTTKKRGWGLGLTLAKRIIEQYHEGKIFVKHSEIGKGTTFRIILNK